jgi:hypothetical protein
MEKVFCPAEELRAQVELCIRKLCETPIGTPQYREYLEQLELLHHAESDERYRLTSPILNAEPDFNAEPAPVTPVAEPEPTAEEPAPAPEPEAPVEEEKPKTLKEIARDKLMQARDAGVIVRPIIEKFVPEGKPVRFSSIPAASYEAFIQEIEDQTAVPFN